MTPNRKLATLLTLALAAVVALALPALASARDRNHDRIPDRWEKRHDLSLKVKQTRRDQDNDGLRNLGEFRSATDPRDVDTDDDGVADGEENRDHDGVDNDNEQREHTRQNDRDSDDDGRPDGREDRDHDGLRNHAEDVSGNDPIDQDTDDDGTEDGDEVVGTVASFDGTTLTIDVFGGGSVSGAVDDTTEISCETEDEDEADNEGPEAGDSSDGDSVDNSGEGSLNSGPGSLNSGDDEGDEDNVCTTADLVPGALVHEAELQGGTFEDVELVK